MVNRADRIGLVGLTGDQHRSGRGETIILHEFHEEIHTRLTGQAMVRENQGQLVPILDDLINHGPRVVDVFGDLKPDLVPKLFKITLERVSHVGLVLEGQDCQGHDSSSCG